LGGGKVEIMKSHAESEEEGEDGYLDHRSVDEAYSKKWCLRVEIESDSVGKAEHNLMLLPLSHGLWLSTIAMFCLLGACCWKSSCPRPNKGTNEELGALRWIVPVAVA